VRRQRGFFAGNARIAVLSAATGAELGAFLKANVAAGAHLLTDGFAGYGGRDAALGEHLKHTPVVQDEGVNAGEVFPIIHTLFSNIKAWLVGVSAKHLPRYLREWSYRFNLRTCPAHWTATSSGAPSNAQPSPMISSRRAPCQAAPTVSGGLPHRLRNLL
jgi:transposase-like protein